MLREQMQTDMKTALKSGDKFTLATIRLVFGDLQSAEKSGKTPKEFSDQETEAFIAKQVKTRRDSAQTYADAGEIARSDRENAEAELLSRYLPEPLGEVEVISIIENAISEIENPTRKSMGQVMKAVNAEVKGRFDGKLISELVKARLA